eukprot:CAMPEP_0115010168 /NCGR_PEP_ID=MMETSP0216-20121206/23130_1 /TAXON_ID=223996 /ORGANISM="Protocruzia adherens, Strain Boccale" /LENGTH=131 /DNA_ID=CAMNT_0002378281 /DNA_START=44 /DNA_END=440 /DNA_ORIENTATION=-
MALSDLGQYQQAIANYEEAIELDPNDSITYNNKGITHSKQGNFKAAVTSYNRALNINPNDSTTLTNKGNLTHTPQTHKTLTLVIVSLGSALSQLGDYEEAIECYDGVIRLGGANGSVYGGKGGAIILIGRV